MRRAEYATNTGHPDEAQKYLDLAMTRFKLYYQIDPVFPPNYYRMAQIHMIRKEYDQAAQVYQDLIDARRCAVEPSLLAKPWLRKSILSYQRYVDVDGSWKHVHADPVLPREAAEAYTSMANALFMGNRFDEAEIAYRKALSFDPTFDMAKKNLDVTYRRAQAEGRLKQVKLEGPPKPVVPGLPVPTGWIIVPKK
jgi:tetratricopeptide (TPR) repeat protein